MAWLQLRLDCDKASTEALEDAVLAAGALSVTLEDRADEPLLEPAVGQTPLWQAVRITGLFSADADPDDILEALDLPADSGANARIEILEDKDWSREWMQYYEPMQYGPRLWICPSWRTPPDPTAVNLLLDPGLAFGTGTHPTTALCLSAIDTPSVEGITVVDYGCGSGILGIAALRLGATKVLAVDNDPQALTATRDNAQRNALNPDTLEVALPGDYNAEPWQGKADWVIANILAGPLDQLADTLTTFLKPGGRLLLAGLLDTQADALIERYAPLLHLEVRQQQEEWVCLEGFLPH